MKQKLLGGGAFAAALAILYVFAMPSYRQGEPSIAGRRASDFTFEMNGKTTHLTDLKGKVVVLDFWASWCPPCVEETPALNALQQRIAAQGGVVLGISQDEDPDAYAKFLQDQHVVFPTYRDDTAKGQMPGKIAAAYGTSIFPESYLISKDGRIASKIVGAQDWDTNPELNSTIDLLLRSQ
jgi:cytochrome c biogenesis protein CcmG/thiol:disulfide interchange protein DsbE